MKPVPGVEGSRRLHPRSWDYHPGNLLSPLIGLCSLSSQRMMAQDSITPRSVRERNAAIDALGARRLS